MYPFMFVIKGIPLPENHNYGTIGGANIHIWVMSDNLSNAKDNALSFIQEYLWKPQSVEHAFEILPGQISQLHEDEAKLYHKALQNGIAADFLAYPVVDGNPNDPIKVGRP